MSNQKFTIEQRCQLKFKVIDELRYTVKSKWRAWHSIALA